MMLTLSMVNIALMKAEEINNAITAIDIFKGVPTVLLSLSVSMGICKINANTATPNTTTEVLVFLRRISSRICEDLICVFLCGKGLDGERRLDGAARNVVSFSSFPFFPLFWKF
jgi:hypothetical protein